MAYSLIAFEIFEIRVEGCTLIVVFTLVCYYRSIVHSMNTKYLKDKL